MKQIVVLCKRVITNTENLLKAAGLKTQRQRPQDKKYKSMVTLKTER